MDAGIIQAVKMTYRKKLAKHLLFKVDQCNSASDLAMQVNVLDAILRLKANWDSVSTSTITKCFVNCGFSGGDISGNEEERVDEDIPYGEEGIMNNITMVQFTEFENDVTTSPSLDDDWEQQIFAKARGDDNHRRGGSG